MHNIPQITDETVQTRAQKLDKQDQKVERLLRRVLHHLERFVAALTIVALIASVALEVYQMFTQSGYFSDVEHVLHNLLTIVVGLEFARMLIDTTPASILEVLTVAITRHVILSHDDPWSNLACIACIAGLFGIRRFLVRRSELQEEMVEAE